MPVKDIDDEENSHVEPAVEGEAAVDGAKVFHVDLPQFVPVEAQRPPAKPLRPLRDGIAPTDLRGRIKAAATGWRVKGAIQKVLGVVPGGHYLHHQLQR